MCINLQPAMSATLHLAPPPAPPLGCYGSITTLAVTATHVIYAGFDRSAGREVIIKYAHAAGATALGLSSEAAMLRFLARHQIAAPRYRGLAEHGGRSALVMSRIPGHTLEALHGAQAVGPGLIVWLAARLCATLAALHRLGYVHHDIKPANIVVRPDYTPVLIDWGTAEAIRPPDDRRPNSGFTPGFVSPSQASGTARPSNDLFAVGMLLDALIDWPGPQLATIIARATGQHHQPFRDAEGLAQALARLRMIDRLAKAIGLKAI